MCDFKPGDEVVCVDSTGTLESLVSGQIYTVSDTGIIDGCVVWTKMNGSAGVKLRDVSCSRIDGNGFYRAARFRKVIRKSDKLSLTEWLSQPSGDTERLDKSNKRTRVNG